MLTENPQSAALRRRFDFRSHPLAWALLCAGLLTACGGGGGGGGASATPVGELEAGLNKLGVNTGKSPRESAPGLRIEESTTPLGRRPVLSRTDELLLLNIGTPSNPRADAPLQLLELTDANGDPTEDVLYGRTSGQAPFAAQPSKSAGTSMGTMRAAVAADLDGNGLEEVVIVYQQGIETRVRRIQDQAGGFVDSDLQLAANIDVTNVAAIAVDLDLDGRDELVLGLTAGGAGRVQAFDFDGFAWQPLGNERTIAPNLTGATLWLQLTSGNVDLDARPEIGIAVQEVFASTGTCRVLVLDDAASDFATLRDEPFSGRDQNQTTRVGLTASIAMGDVDGDGLDEVLAAGLTAFASTNQTTKVFCLALDDASNQFASLGGYYRTVGYQQSSASGNNLRIRTVHLNALDIDGDGVDEVYANELGFQDFAEAGAPWSEDPALALDANVVWYRPTVWLNRTSSSFVVGNFDGDDREDLAVYRQDAYEAASGATPSQRGVRVFGLPATATSVVETRRVQCEPVQGGTAIFPILLPVNVDADSPVLTYSEAEYRLVFSEPIVLAALAAPPTRDGIGQNIAGSSTAFGNTTSQGSERERSVTFSAGVSVGVISTARADAVGVFVAADADDGGDAHTRSRLRAVEDDPVHVGPDRGHGGVHDRAGRPVHVHDHVAPRSAARRREGGRQLPANTDHAAGRARLLQRVDPGRSAARRLDRVPASGRRSDDVSVAHRQERAAAALRRPADRPAGRRAGRRLHRGHVAGGQLDQHRWCARGGLRTRSRGDRGRRAGRHLGRRQQREHLARHQRHLDDLHRRRRRDRRAELRGKPLFVRSVYLCLSRAGHEAAVPGAELLGGVAGWQRRAGARRLGCYRVRDFGP